MRHMRRDFAAGMLLLGLIVAPFGWAQEGEPPGSTSRPAGEQPAGDEAAPGEAAGEAGPGEAAPGQAQGGDDGAQVPPGPEHPVTPAPPPPRDPTQPTPSLGWTQGPGLPATTRLPEIRLRGRVLVAGQPPAAMIEVDGELHLVHRGDELTIGRGGRAVPSPRRTTGRSRTAGRVRRAAATGRNGSPLTHNRLTLRVTELDARELRVEIVRFNETITVR